MNIGDKLPEILGVNTKGETVRSSDFAGRPLIVYFYPKDNTPGCTAEACSFRDGYQQLTDMGYTVIGISKDSPASHLKFIAKYDLNFILLSDESTEGPCRNSAYGRKRRWPDGNTWVSSAQPSLPTPTT